MDLLAKEAAGDLAGAAAPTTTERAGAAAHALERRGTIGDAEVRYPRADLEDDTDDLVAEHHRGDASETAAPRDEVVVANPAGLDLDKDLTRTRPRIRELLHLQVLGTTERTKNDRLHLQPTIA